jgi:hypothetical protein
MPQLEPIDVILSGDNAIITTFPASKLINCSPSKLSLLISNKGINVITDAV